MAKTPWEMAAVGKEFSEQSALFAWAAMARGWGLHVASQPFSYMVAGYAKTLWEAKPPGFDDRLPQLKWLHAIKNQGHGDAIRGSRSAAEGVRPGVADVFLPVPMETLASGVQFRSNGKLGVISGLYLELKRVNDKGEPIGKASDKQLEFQADMRAAGYACEIVFGWEAARDTILRYLGH